MKNKKILIIISIIFILCISIFFVIRNKSNNSVIKEPGDKYISEVLGYPYCGDINLANTDEVIIKESNTYYKSNTYTTLTDLKDYLNTFMTKEYINEVIDNNNYVEENDNLYCYVPSRGRLIYKENSTSYKIIEEDKDKIIASVSYKAVTEGGEVITIKAELIFKRENNKWLLSSYEEEL